jgi:hypothetical protein
MKTAIRIPKIMRIEFLTLISVFLCFWGCSSDDSPDLQPPNAFGTLSGTILSGEGTAYAMVKVDLEAGGGNIEVSGVTDASGNYEITQVPVGNYTLNVHAPLGSTIANNRPSVSIADGQVTNKDFIFEIKTNEAYVVLSPIDPLGEVKNVDAEIPSGNEAIYTPFSVSNPGMGPLSAILAPDGHHVTLNEWRMASGTARVSCDGVTTHYIFELSGLIPNGVYTLWNALLEMPQEPENGLAFPDSFIGLGALKDSGSNSFIASAQGEAQMEISADPGSLSMFGTQPPCAITGSESFIIVVDYHIDNTTHGPSPGPDFSEVAHLLFYF